MIAGRRGGRRPAWQLALVVVAGLVYGLLLLRGEADVDRGGVGASPAASVGAEAQAPGASGAAGVSSRLVEAIERRQSEVWVETAAEVTRLLRDDDRGSRHQRFLVDVAGNSVLVAHNIDLAERVPLEQGDVVEIRGRFEWNDRGGVLHWTHHDPGGGPDEGWIRHRGRVYR